MDVYFLTCLRVFFARALYPAPLFLKALVMRTRKEQ